MNKVKEFYNKYQAEGWELLSVVAIIFAAIMLFVSKERDIALSYIAIAIYAEVNASHVKQMRKLNRLEKKLKNWRVSGFGNED